MDHHNFCASCGGSLTPEGTARPKCSRCGRISYLDPKLAAAAIVAIDGRLLLVKRAIEPSIGKWSFPSGYVDRGEVVELAVEREVFEETGLRVKTAWLVGLYSQPGNAVVLAVYAASVSGGKMKAGEEALELGLFDPESLPELAFEHDTRIVSDWRRSERLRQR